MKPIKISIRGFNSFLDEQSIDFEELGKMGIFGIFGPTGSGKSSILDALTFALYGRIARDNAREQYININTDTARIIFEFSIDAGSKEIYKAIREIKKDKDGKVSTKQLKLLRVFPQEEIIAEKEGEFKAAINNIIGLEYQDFIKTVVLPQGGFNDFLKMEGRDRRVILERLFNLEEYGDALEKKIKLRLDYYESENTKLTGGLALYKEYTEEAFAELDKELNKCFEELREIELKKENSELKLNLNWSSYEKQLRIAKLKSELEDQYSLEADIDSCRKRLELNSIAERILPFIADYESSINKENETQAELEKIKQSYEQIQQQTDSAKKRYIKYENEFNERGSLLFERKIILNALISDWEDYAEKTDKFSEFKKIYDKLNRDYNLCLKDYDTKSSEISELNTKISNLKEKLKADTVDAAFRNRLIKVCELYTTLSQLEKNFKSLDDSDNADREKIKKLEAEINIKREKLNSAEGKIKELEKLKAALNNHPLSLPMSASSLIQDYEELYNKIEKRENLKNNLESINTELEALNQECKKTGSELKASNEKLSKLNIERETYIKNLEIFNISKNLKPQDVCPICGNVIQNITHKTNSKDFNNFNNKINRLESEIKNTEKNIQGLLQAKAEIEAKLAVINERKEKNLEEISLLDIVGIPDSLIIKIKQISDVSEDEHSENYIKAAESLLEKAKIISSDKIDDTTDMEIKNIKDFILNDIIRIKKLSEGIIKELSGCNEKSKELNEEKNRFLTELAAADAGLSAYESNIEKNIPAKQSLLGNINTIKEEINIKYNDCKSNPKAELERLSNLEKINAEISLEIESDEQKLEELNSAANTNCLKLNELNLEKKEYETKLTEYEKDLISLKSKLSDINGELENPAEELKAVIKEASELEANLKTSRQAFDRFKEEAFEIEKSVAVLEKNLKYIKEAAAAKKAEVLNKFKQYSTEDRGLSSDIAGIISEINRNILKDSLKSELEVKVKKYDEAVKQLSMALEELQSNLGESYLSEEEYKASELENKKINEAYKKINEKAITLRERHAEFIKRLNESEELNKKSEVIAGKIALVKELKAAVGARKFVEFMALKQLDYIAASASERLFEISSGAYGLETSEDGSFKIRDYKNGGKLRNVKTLSGGESFVVSLSLALALSAHIQLKSSAPLELFFLDEGFGTLDEDLLEVVMDSLERVHNERLKVGLISHVEYLKQRVPVKLIVKPALLGGGGSKVSLEYS